MMHNITNTCNKLFTTHGITYFKITSSSFTVLMVRCGFTVASYHNYQSHPLKYGYGWGINKQFTTKSSSKVDHLKWQWVFHELL